MKGDALARGGKSAKYNNSSIKCSAEKWASMFEDDPQAARKPVRKARKAKK